MFKHTVSVIHEFGILFENFFSVRKENKQTSHFFFNPEKFTDYKGTFSNNYDIPPFLVIMFYLSSLHSHHSRDPTALRGPKHVNTYPGNSSAARQANHVFRTWDVGVDTIRGRIRFQGLNRTTIHIHSFITGSVQIFYKE